MDLPMDSKPALCNHDNMDYTELSCGNLIYPHSLQSLRGVCLYMCLSQYLGTISRERPPRFKKNDLLFMK